MKNFNFNEFQFYQPILNVFPGFCLFYVKKSLLPKIIEIVTYAIPKSFVISFSLTIRIGIPSGIDIYVILSMVPN